MARNRLPIKAYDLIDWLDEQFPEESPRPGVTPEQLWFAAGKRDLVRQLVDRKKRELEDK